MNIILSRRAFSIVELSIAIAIIAVLMGVILSSNRLAINANLATAGTLTKNSPVNDIDNLVLWLETTMPQSISDAQADNGDSVSTWYDLSPEKDNAVAGTAPTYVTNVINGLPVVRFVSSGSQFLTFDEKAMLNTNYTIFIVAARNSSQNNNLIIGGTTVAGTFVNLHAGWFLNSTPRFRISHYGEATSGTDYVDYSTTTFTSPIFAVHSFNFDSAVGRYYYENGLQRASVTSSAAKTPISAWTGSAIGRFGTTYFNGDVAEIIMFNRNLKVSERKEVEAYLGKKWGIAIS